MATSPQRKRLCGFYRCASQAGPRQVSSGHSLSDRDSGTFQRRTQSLLASSLDCELLEGKDPFEHLRPPPPPPGAQPWVAKVPQKQFSPNSPNSASCADGLVILEAKSWELWCHSLEGSEEGFKTLAQENHISKVEKNNKGQ